MCNVTLLMPSKIYHPPCFNQFSIIIIYLSVNGGNADIIQKLNDTKSLEKNNAHNLKTSDLL